jgi:hypothetical protein
MLPSDPLASEATKDCRWCAAKIPQQALICKECKSDQLRTVYFIRWLAGVSSVLALLGAAVTFIAANWQETSKRLFWRDSINLVHLNGVPGYKFNAVLSNTGDGPVFVSVVIVYWRGSNHSFRVQKTVPSRDFSVLIEESESWASNAGYLASSTGIPTENVLQSAAINARLESGCFVTNFYDAGAPDLTRMNSFYSARKRTLVTDPAKVDVHYSSLHDGKVAVANFDVVATFLRRDKPECATAE